MNRYAVSSLTVVIGLAAVLIVSSFAQPDAQAQAQPDVRADIASPAPVATEAVQPTEAAPTGGTETGAAEPWQEITLTDAATGETFTVADLMGNVVTIEPMAIWCITCKYQQDEIVLALPDLQDVGVTVISLDVDPNERAEDLAVYAERNGYDWTFAVSSTELSRALADRFGSQTLNPPSTPLIVLTPDGEVVFHEVGVIHSAEQLVAIVTEAAG